MNKQTIHGEHCGSTVITGCVRGFILFSLILLMVVGTVSAAEVAGTVTHVQRSEEHTSELQSRRNLVCRLLLEYY